MSEWVSKSILTPYATNSVPMPVVKLGSTSNDLSPQEGVGGVPIIWQYSGTPNAKNRTIRKQVGYNSQEQFIVELGRIYNQLADATYLQNGLSEAYWQIDKDPRNRITQTVNNPLTQQYKMNLASEKYTTSFYTTYLTKVGFSGMPYPIKWALALFTVEGHYTHSGNYLGIISCYGLEDGGYLGSSCQITLYNIEDHFGRAIDIPTEDEETNPDYPDPSGGGGYDPDPDPSSDPIDIPSDPPFGFSTSGLYNVYKISSKGLLGLASELFQDVDINFDGISGVEDTLKAIGDLIKNGLNMFINNNLIQFVLDCHILPCSPSTGEISNIDIGFREFSQTGELVTSDYVTINCGTLNIKEYYSNYIDYLTKFDLVLPFIGTVPIEPEYIQNGAISVVYKFNIIDGSCVAFVKSTSSKSSLSDTVIGTYTGSCCVHLPITGQNYASMLTETLNGSLGALVTATGENPHGAISNALDVLSSRPNFQSSNGYNATSSILGMRTPYLIIKRPVASFSRGYTHDKGLPSNVYTRLSDLNGTGFATISKIDLSGLNLLKEEKDELEQLLMEGVYF